MGFSCRMNGSVATFVFERAKIIPAANFKNRHKRIVKYYTCVIDVQR